MQSFAPPAAAQPKSAGPDRRAVGPRPARAPLHFAGLQPALREQPAAAAPIAARPADALPERLQSVIEAMSGFSLADVVVHRNSAEPARLGAAAFVRGDQIHLGPGEQRHLPHEAWHVVQQKQGRVRATAQLKDGSTVNDESVLEREADAMGARAATSAGTGGGMAGADGPPLRVRRLAGGGAAQCKDVSIGKGKAVTNLENFYKRKDYAALAEPFIDAFGRDAVDFHLSQMFSAPDDINFLSDQHFEEALQYDLLNKSQLGEGHTLQEQYLTRYGWQARLRATEASSNVGSNAASSKPSGKGSASTASTAKGSTSSSKQEKGHAPARLEQLKVYRTLKADDWKALQKGDLKCLVGKHLGDFKQAQNYLFRNAGEGKSKLLIEFVLKPGAELSLFSPNVMEIQGNAKSTSILRTIQSTLTAEKRGTLGEGANKNEGMIADKIGLKMEAGESGFSFSISGGESPKLFMSHVAGMRVIGQSDGKTVMPLEQVFGGADRVVAAGHTFDPVDPRVRIGGHCLWDTLRVVGGYTIDQMKQAATRLRTDEALAIEFGRDVEDTHVWPLLQALGATGLTLVRWQYGKEDEAAADPVEGDGSVVIGFAYDESGAGHYVPPHD